MTGRWAQYALCIANVYARHLPSAVLMIWGTGAVSPTVDGTQRDDYSNNLRVTKVGTNPRTIHRSTV